MNLAAARTCRVEGGLLADEPLHVSVPPQEVIVLGAGLAGLVAAYELGARGYRPVVYEGSHRVGGRIYTHRFAEGLHGELGAMRIPKHHRHVLGYIDRLGLGAQLVPFRSAWSNGRCWVDFGDRVLRQADAVADLADGPELRGLPATHPTTRRFVAALKLAVDTASPREIRSRFTADLPGVFGRVDEALRSGNLRVPEHDLHPARVLGHVLPLVADLNPALQRFLPDIASELSAELYALRDGMDILPRALAERVGREQLRFGHEVRSIHIGEEAVEVGFANGARVRARRVLCTLPYSVMRDLERTGFSASKRWAMDTLPYAPAAKVLLRCRRRFWEADPHAITGGGSASARFIRQVYYPSAVPESPAGEGGVLLASYGIGGDALPLCGAIAAGDYASVLSAVAVLHPEVLEPGMVEQVVGVSWARRRWTRGACSVLWDAGPDTDVLEHHTRRAEGRVRFAGEHCSDQKAWLEGAVSSALEQVEALDEELRADRHARGEC